MWIWLASLMLSSLLGWAGAEVPRDAHSKDCPLDGLPGAQLAWTEDGRIWILESGEVLVFSEIGLPLAQVDAIHCQGAVVTFTVFHDGKLARIESARLDLKDALARHLPRPCPEQRLDKALNARNLPRTLTLLESMDRKESFVVAGWIRYAELALAQGDTGAAGTAILGLPPETPGRARIEAEIARGGQTEAQTAFNAGKPADALLNLAPALAVLDRELPEWSAQERSATRLLHGQILAALGQSEQSLGILESLVATSPDSGHAWLCIGDLYWKAGDRKRSRAAYLHAARCLPAAELPPELLERCRKCGR